MKDHIIFEEYDCPRMGCIRPREPKCPFVAVIPSVVVEDTSGLKNLNDCFVHVTSINTTYYIDDKHRITITWAGPVEANDYDFEANPSKLRGQVVYDFANNKGAYYGNKGGYRLFDLTAPTEGE